MSGLYDRAAVTATRLLARFGGPVTWRQSTTGAYDPTTSSAAVAYVDTTVTAAALDFGAGQTYQRGFLIQGGDKRLLLNSAQVPNLHDHFVVNGVEYTIVSIGEVNPAGTSVLFDLHLRA